MSSYIFYYYLLLIFITTFKKTFSNPCDQTKCKDCDHIAGKCNNCIFPYFFSGNESNLEPSKKYCYHLSDFPENYYIDPLTNLIEKCNERCKTCQNLKTPSDDDHKCILCNEGYYKKDNDTFSGNCYKPYEIENNYYLDESTQTFKKCYDRCNTCSELGNFTDNKCDSCKNNISNSDIQYYKMDTFSAGNCVLFSEIPSYYNIPENSEFNEEATKKINIRNYNYQNGDQYKILIYEKIARKCYKNCDECNEFGNDDDMKCITCIKNYYFYKNNCYKKCPKPETYQLKNNNFQCIELVDGYKIVTDYETSNEIIDFLYYNGFSEFDSEQNLIIAKKIFGQIYSFKNKKTNDELADKLKLSKIYFSENCIQKILKNYNLENDTINDLILIKIDRNYTDYNSEKKSSVNQIDYYLFYPDYEIDTITNSKIINGTYHEIPLTICQEDEIIINKPIINFDETLTGMELKKAVSVYNYNNNYDIFDAKNIFFSDICSIYKSEKGKDVPIQERQIKYFQNISLCEGNCIFSKFDYENYRLNCSCNSSINLLYTQYNLTAYKERRKIIKNLAISTISNKFPENTSISYELLNLKTMKCKHLIFDTKIAIKNSGNWFSLIIAIIKFYFLYHFLTKKFLPITEEYNKRKNKIENTFLAQIPDAKIMTQEDLQKIPKYNIEKEVWLNYAGSFKYNNIKKIKQSGLLINDHYENKFNYIGSLINENHDEFPTIEDEKEEKNKQNIENNIDNNDNNDNINNINNIDNINNINTSSPPKRFGYILSDDLNDETKENESIQKGYESTKRELKRKKNNSLIKSNYYEKDGKVNTTNIIFQSEKTDFSMLSNNENDKKTEDGESENIKNFNKSFDGPLKIDEILKKNNDKSEAETSDKIHDQKNENLKINQLINDEIDYKNDQKEMKEFIDNKENQEKNINNLNKQNEKNYGEENEKEKYEIITLKKLENQNFIENSDEMAKYKNENLNNEDIEQNVFRIKPEINYRFSSMNSAEKLLFMKYRYAIDLDRRTFKEIYIGCIKLSQPIMNFIFIPYYFKMKFLKFYFLIFVFNINLLTTTIFYSSFFISKMYGFKLLICLIESIFISIMLYLFSYSKKKFTSVHVLDIHRFSKMKKIYSVIVILMIIIEIIISGYIWYISSAFCSVYQNSNIFYFLHVIESIIINLVLPFGLSVIPTILRYFALVNESKILFYINNIVDIIF